MSRAAPPPQPAPARSTGTDAAIKKQPGVRRGRRRFATRLSVSTINARAANHSARDGSRLYAATKSIASTGDLASITIAPRRASRASP